jgi:hypothetical protein
MRYRKVYSKVSFLAVWAILLLSTASMVFLVSSTGYDGFDCFIKPETQSIPATDSPQETRTMPAADSIQENQSIVSSTGSIQETRSTPDIIMIPTFTVLPQEVVVNVSDTFSVFVFAENVTDMYGWQIRLCFDPKIVECINVSVPEQNVFSDGYPVSQALIDYNSTEFTKKPLQSINNDEGYVLAGDCLLGDNQTTFYGSGFLCKITFKAISSGSSQLVLALSDIQSTVTYCIDSRLGLTTPSVSNSKVAVLPE